MSDGTFPSLVSKDRNVNAVANPIYVQLTDGSAIVTVTGSRLDVNANLDIALVDDSAFSIGSSEVGAIGYLADESAPDQVQEGDIGIARMTLDRKQLMVIVSGTGPSDDTNRWEIDDNGFGLVKMDSELYWKADDSAFALGNERVMPVGFIADESSTDSVDEGDIGLARMTLNRKIIIASDLNDGDDFPTGNFYVDMIGAQNQDGNIDILNQDAAGIIRCTPNRVLLNTIVDETNDAYRLVINSDGSINANIVSAIPSVNEVHNYDTSVNVGSDLTDNHDYTVPSDTFLLKSVIVSASGNMKFEIQAGPLATLATIAVGFLTGRQGDTKQIFFDPAVEVPVASTGTVRIIRTNRQGAAMDVYSTIIGALV